MTPARLMRTPLLPSRLLSGLHHHVSSRTSSATAFSSSILAGGPGSSSLRCHDPHACLRNCRCFAQVQDVDRLNRDVWFTSSAPRTSIGPDAPRGDHQPPDERTLQLGQTVRVLHQRLPTLLKEPLPSEILSPQISLHLFPSTHPHLPTVSGRIAYIAALWTAPVVWGRVPLVGNVKLTILSERMVRNGGLASTPETRSEKLIVKWKTCGKAPSGGGGSDGAHRGSGLGSTASARESPVDRIKDFIAGSTVRSRKDGLSPVEPAEFCGIFVFEFDDQGRIVKHVIEHTEEGGHWDRTAKVVSVTDWLLGRFNGKGKEDEPALAWCQERPRDDPIRALSERYPD